MKEKPRSFMKEISLMPEKQRIPLRMGFVCSLVATLLGAIYVALIIVLIFAGQFSLPPPELAQMVGAITSIISVPLIIITFISIHYLTDENKKSLSHMGIIFCTMFGIFVSINRFVQLGVVRLSMLEGNMEGLSRFYPYEPRSATFALELIGWGTFLSLALLFMAFALNKKGLNRGIRILSFIYFILGIISSIGYLSGSPIAAVGFIAWGLVLFIITGFFTVSFYKCKRHWIP